METPIKIKMDDDDDENNNDDEDDDNGWMLSVTRDGGCSRRLFSLLLFLSSC
jgi:hypothetical protein